MEKNLNKLKDYCNLNFKKIYQLKRRNYSLYTLFFQLLNDNKDDLVRYLQLLYIAYYMNCSEEISLEHFFYLINDHDLNGLVKVYLEVFEIKQNSNFRRSFYRKQPKKVKVPEFKLEDVEDYYSYYVLVLGISEDLFWNIDLSFLISVSVNKSAYDSFISSEKLKLSEERR